MIDEIMTLIRCGASEEGIRKHIELAMKIAVCDAKIEAYRDGAETVTKIFKEEMCT